MIKQIVLDSDLKRDIFSWWGPLPLPAIELWERERSLCFPSDLKLLWNTKGGGDLFESETILQPFGAPEHDLIWPASQPFWEKGLSPEYCIFQTGLFNSVFRKLDGAIFSLASADLTQMVPYQDLDDWYRRTLRATFAERYHLPPP